MKLYERVGFILLGLLAVPLAYNALTYLNLDTRYGFLLLKKQAIETGWYLPAYYAHVLVAGVILVVGLFQIHPTLGLRWPGAHRTLGKLYIGGILFFSAPGGLFMSLFINRGAWVLASFVLQCSAWFTCTYLAYHFIRKGDVQTHRQWVLRSYSLTLAAITLRVYVFISSWSIDLAQPTAYAAIAWLSWVPNVLICEWYLRTRPSRVFKRA